MNNRLFLCVGVIVSNKNNVTRYYVKGYFWNDDKLIWAERKNRDGVYGASLIECDRATYDSVRGGLRDGLVVDTEVTGYDAYDHPIRKIVC